MFTTGQRKRWQSCASFEAQMQATGCLHPIGPPDEPAMGETDGQPLAHRKPLLLKASPRPRAESRLWKNQCLCTKGVVVNTSWHRPLCLGFLGVAASPFPQLSLVFLCLKKKVMNLGLPNSPLKRVLPNGWHSTRGTCHARVVGRDGIARCGCVSTGALQKLCVGRATHQAGVHTNQLRQTMARCSLQTHQAPSAPGRGGAQASNRAQEGGREEVPGYKQQANRRESPPSGGCPLLFGNQQFLILYCCYRITSKDWPNDRQSRAYVQDLQMPRIPGL